MNSQLLLSVSHTQLDTFCKQLTQRSDDISKTHSTLVALESFIRLFASESNSQQQTQAISNLINRYTTTTRELLMQQRCQQLKSALQAQDTETIRKIHTPMSRAGFYQVLLTASHQIDREEIESITHWCQHWVKKARLLAEKASGYPEAYDFRRAGINIEVFQAMQDISQYLNIHSNQ